MYSVIITDNNGCSISDSIMLDPVFTLNSTTSSTQVSCTGSSDGTANVIVTGGLSPYTYQWNNGLTTSNVVGLFAGIYNVTVTDDNGCLVTDSILVTESDSALAFTSNLSNLNCFQDSSGSISISVTGGAGDYMYSWSNSDTSSLISNTLYLWLNSMKSIRTPSGKTIITPKRRWPSTTGEIQKKTVYTSWTSICRPT